jgi:hypothetical protein
MAAPADAPAIHVDDWVDARAMSLEHSDTFEAPDDDALRAIRPGVTVKISNGEERFWVMVTGQGPAEGADPCDWIHRGAVDNGLVFERPYDLGDTVEFRGRHIYCIYSPRDPQ